MKPSLALGLPLLSPPESRNFRDPSTASGAAVSDRVAELKRKRLLTMLLAGLAVAAATALSRLLALDASPPAGVYIVSWALATGVVLAVVHLVFARAIDTAARLQGVEGLAALSDQPENVDILIGKLSEITRPLYGLELVAYSVSESVGGTGLRFVASTQLTPEHQRALRDIFDRGLSTLSQSGTPIVQARDDLGPIHRAALASLGADTVVMVPLLWAASLLGAVFLAGAGRGELNPGERRFMATLGRQIASALSSAYLQRRQKAIEREISAYRQLAEAIAQAQAVHEVLPAIARLVNENLEADGTGVIIGNPQTGDVAAMAGVGVLDYWSSEGRERGQDVSIMAHVCLAEKGSVRLARGGPPGVMSPVAELASRFGPGAALAVPVQSQGRASGVAIAIRRGADRPFSEEDEHRLMALSGYLATSVENARLYSLARERADQLARLAEFKRHLIFSLTHEIRASLSALKVATDVLLEEDSIEPDSDTYFRLLQSISRNVARQNDLVSNLMDLASLEDATLSLKPDMVNVLDLVTEATAIVAPMMDQRGQVLSISVPPDLPTIMADRRRLSQVLVNLLTNAAKYAPEGSEVSVAVQLYDREVVFRVSDSGPGISPEERERIFEAFYRAPDTGETSIPSSGLGLAIARSLVELHRGSIWVEDSETGGASFVFSVPVEGVNEHPGH